MTTVYVSIPTDPAFTSYTKHWCITNGEVSDVASASGQHSLSQDDEPYPKQSYSKLNHIFHFHIDQSVYHDVMIKLGIPSRHGKCYRLWAHTFKGIGADRRKNPYVRCIDLYSDYHIWDIPNKNGKEGTYPSHAITLMDDY
jgi:hypothetical protein